MARLRYIVKTGKKGPNKDVQDGFFPKKNKVCCTIIFGRLKYIYVHSSAHAHLVHRDALIRITVDFLVVAIVEHGISMVQYSTVQYSIV